MDMVHLPVEVAATIQLNIVRNTLGYRRVLRVFVLTVGFNKNQQRFLARCAEVGHGDYGIE